MAEGHLSEAACLIEQGATYRRRVGLRPLQGHSDPIFTGFKPGAFAVYFGDAPFYHFDLEGRWQRAFVDGTHYLKALDGSVQSIDRVREGPNLVLKRNTLSHAAASEFDSQVRSMALDLIADLDAEKLGRVEPTSPKAVALPQDELREFLTQVTRWNGAAWFAHRERHFETYGPMPFLPPECLSAVVLQATLGQTGQFGSGLPPVAEPHRRSPDEFRQHAREVAALWGRRLLQSRTIFLAGSNVLRLPEPDVKEYLAAIGEVFPIEPGASKPSRNRTPEGADAAPRFDGIHIFLDDFCSGAVGRPAWTVLATLGLSRVSLGMTSGDPAVRSLYHQQWSDEEFRLTFADLKAAGLGASILALVGAGGVGHAAAHMASTAALIMSLDLRPGDFVFLLDANELRDLNDAPRVFSPLSPGAHQDEQAKLQAALAPLKARKVKVLPYTIEKQGI
jgi:hypothetical protein